MGRLLRFLGLPVAKQWLLIKAASVLAAVRTLLKVFPFPRVIPWMEAAGRRSGAPVADAQSPEDLAWAMGVAGGVLPGGHHCLSQAMALQILMRRRGYSCKVCFGVQKDAGSRLAAHAWLEHEGTVLIGGDNLHRLVQLTPPPRFRS
jgi:hypothetical protein